VANSSCHSWHDYYPSTLKHTGFKKEREKEAVMYLHKPKGVKGPTFKPLFASAAGPLVMLAVLLVIGIKRDPHHCTQNNLNKTI
jgi:hypothetical protein